MPVRRCAPRGARATWTGVCGRFAASASVHCFSSRRFFGATQESLCTICASACTCAGALGVACVHAAWFATLRTAPSTPHNSDTRACTCTCTHLVNLLPSFLKRMCMQSSALSPCLQQTSIPHTHTSPPCRLSPSHIPSMSNLTHLHLRASHVPSPPPCAATLPLYAA